MQTLHEVLPPVNRLSIQMPLYCPSTPYVQIRAFLLTHHPSQSRFPLVVTSCSIFNLEHCSITMWTLPKNISKYINKSAHLLEGISLWREARRHSGQCILSMSYIHMRTAWLTALKTRGGTTLTLTLTLLMSKQYTTALPDVSQL